MGSATTKQVEYIKSLFRHTLQPEEDLTELIMGRYGEEDPERITFRQANALIGDLKFELNKMRAPSRKFIINRLATLGYTKEDGSPDIERINKFIQNIGSNNPQKKILNMLYPAELNKVVSQVKAMFRKEIGK